MAFDWQKFQQITQAVGKMMDAYSKSNQQAHGEGGVVSPARVGPLLPPTHVTFDPRHAGSEMLPPVAQPSAMPYSPPPGGSILQSKLTPSGAAAYSGIQGVAQFLTQWNERQDQKKQAEAANIAGNLMHAVRTGNSTMAYEIMTDPKAMRIINKVYKGWLTPVKEEKKAKKPNPELQGFEQGLQKYLQGQSSQEPAMPHQIGGYLLPSQAPADINQAAMLNAEIQANKQNPVRMLGVAPREKIQIGEKMAELGWSAQFQKTLATGYYGLLKAKAQEEAALNRELAVAGLKDADRERLQSLEDDAKKERQQLQYELRSKLADQILKGKPAQSNTIAYQAMKELLDNATKQKTSFLSLLKASKDETTTKFANEQIKSLDQQIQDYQTQMQGLKDQDVINKVLPFLFGGGSSPDLGGTQ